MAYNSDRFNLSNWKITLPVDSKGNISGTAVEVQKLSNYESNYFWDAPDGAMVFRASVDGATTSGSKYARSELREMKGDDRAAWKLSEGGTMTATLKVDEVPTRTDGSGGKIVIGQIHGEDHELIRLYYEKGSVYFVNDRAGSGNKETSFTFKNAQGEQPNISLGEKFSYLIDARGNTLMVKIYADGKEYSSVTNINSVWQSDQFYFKAGVYLGVNETTGKGHGQASFYGLDFSHKAGEGMGGWKSDVSSPPPSDTPPPVDEDTDDHQNNGDGEENGHGNNDGDPQDAETPETPPAPPPPPPAPQNPAPQNKPVQVSGNDYDNILTGGSSNEVLKGYKGNDLVKGGAGNDYLWGNEGNDTLVGGMGADTLKGGNGADTYVVMKQGQIVNIVDFSVPNKDRIDVSDVLGTVFGFKKSMAFDKGYVQVRQDGKDVAIYADVDGHAGSGEADLIAMLNNAVTSRISLDAFILPEDAQPATEQTPPAQQPESGEQVDLSPLNINGTYGRDILTGGNGNDVIRGQSGHDVLHGGNGNDFLWGNDGKDTITGGLGADTIKGGNGNDVYVYNNLQEGGDIIQDFRKGEKLDISGMVDNHSAMENLTAKQLLQQGFITFEEKSATQTDVYVDVDGNAGPSQDVLLATLNLLAEHDIDSSIILL